jgi:hypothetical protein
MWQSAATSLTRSVTVQEPGGNRTRGSERYREKNVSYNIQQNHKTEALSSRPLTKITKRVDMGEDLFLASQSSKNL